MPKIIEPIQQFNLQQKIARKSITDFRPKLQSALQHDFNKAAQLVHELGAQQVVNFKKTFFSQQKVSNILRTLYEGVGGYTAMRYQKIFDKYKKDDSIDFNVDSIFNDWLAFMLTYWTSISGPKMNGIQNTTDNEIAKLLTQAIEYGRKNNLSNDEVNKMAIQLLKDGSINNARSLMIVRTETHQALSTGALGAAQKVNIPLLKQWVAAEYPTKTGMPRYWHRALDSQTNPDVGGVRIPVNQPFMVNTPKYGVIEMQYAHDASGGAINNCNCRCCTVYVD
jgi:hypothetical protein